MLVFLWGAHNSVVLCFSIECLIVLICLDYQILPQFPLPTHDVVVRGGAPCEFEVRLEIVMPFSK